MSLPPGARVGSYEILAKLGEGGMGEVYRARDTKLDRDVALKILPELFTSDPDRLARFEREAKMLASLNHPNIAHVYGLEGDGSVLPDGKTRSLAIAMELVEGRDLTALIAGSEDPGLHRRGIPLADALPIARQIADALDAAHERGIVHRDLKPANVKVRDDGTVKVLDFGLAKALQGDGAQGETSPSIANSPTLTARATQMGMILGTAAYMAPEQAKGRAVDRRADIWAFGVVLFEMLAGRRAFEGEDLSDVLASVLKMEPDWSALPSDLPAPVVRLIRRCLEKDPKRRLRDVSEGMLQLEEGLAAGSASGAAAAAGQPRDPVASATPRPVWRRALPFAATAVAAGLAVFGIVVWRAPAPPPAEVVRFLHVPSPDASLISGSSFPDLAVFPDGRAIVYSTIEAGTSVPVFHLRRLDQVEAVRLRGTEGGLMPFVSPTGEWVGFVDLSQRGVLKRVSALGGPPLELAQVSGQVRGATWTTEGTIVFGANSGGLFRIPEGGGEPVALTTPDEAQEHEHVWPSAIPGTDLILFVTAGSGSAFADGKIAVLDGRSGDIVRLDLAGSNPRWAPSGHIVYAAGDGTLRAVGFDLDRLVLTGSPVPVVDEVGVGASGTANFDIARDGRLVYASGAGIGERTLAWVDRAGQETPIGAPARAYFYARVSPDGARLSLDVRDEEQDIWIWDLARAVLQRLTDQAGGDQYGLWTPDGTAVVFSSEDGLYRQRADGTGTPERLTTHGAGSGFPNAVSPDGQVVYRAASGGANDLFVVPLEGDRTPAPLLATEHDELNAAISPDGRWMAYESNLSGRVEIYVRPFPDVNAGHWTVSNAGGAEPAWAPNGREIFYVSPDRKLMSVPVETSDVFSPGVPVALFDTSSYFFGGVGRNYDVAPDGKRFVMVKNPASGAAASTPIVVVLNWAEELKARVR